jgi:hypothetical protein
MEKPKKVKAETADVLRNVKFDRPADETGTALYPILFDLLCPRWRDGVQTRKAGRLSVRCDGGAYRVSIECPTEGVQTTVLLTCLDTLVADIEAFLGSGKTHWSLTWAQQKKAGQGVDDAIQ